MISEYLFVRSPDLISMKIRMIMYKNKIVYLGGPLIVDLTHLCCLEKGKKLYGFLNLVD